MIRDNVVAILRDEGQIRHVDKGRLASATCFFLERIDATLQTARRHPLGFIVISESLGNHLTLRYHLWPQGWEVPEGQETGQTHDHCFELNSLILCGSLRQYTFGATMDPAGGHAVFEIDYVSSGASKLRDTGLTATLEQNADDVFHAGIAYRLPQGIVHCVDTVRRPAATLVLSIGVPDAPQPRVFVPLGKNPPGVFDRERLDDGEIATARVAIAELRNGVYIA